ncbi:bifunctional 3-(3-hydroxy-phenyl)propionate/3-hydroxycinnamic acid hydroxylase [Leptospira ilyithenensis]|uniref:bifunctional 3-(3-hydroxy-phenyl)propionate/3-hydroxycinnamic acid hydroxylase n=1 Tax=Leptospira ilyithenensis TaxID=2484901 RepID=UPI0014383CB3|nr:bifunctional 3-(3-hydroxy-phenyl)propionate/3-hydroxycinnamic acid hydroxylase [Leptospira ilyithenensis]
MKEESETKYDVIIVGLGPTGAVLANILGKYGHSVGIFEREEDLYYAPRAVHFDDEIMRIFQAIGLWKEIHSTSEAFKNMEFHLKPKGKPIFTQKIGNQDNKYGHEGAFWFHQPTLELQLRNGLKRFSSVVSHLGYEVKEISPNIDYVKVSCKNKKGNQITASGKYLIGCDGGKSAIRKYMQIGLHTADFDESWVVIDTKTRSGQKESSLPKVHIQVCNPKQPVTYVPLAGPYYEWQFMTVGDRSEKQATDPSFVREQLREFVDLNLIEINRIAYYKFHGLWAKQWKNGRVLLAGDSAHQMPPFLGQGMCSGVRDAHNLGWKLHLVLTGKADDQFLDSYEQERSPHVQSVIKGAMLLGRLIQTKNKFVAFFRNNFLFRLGRLVPFYGNIIYKLANRKRPLQEGIFGKNRKRLAGHLIIQPKVSVKNGDPVLFDSLIGDHFVILTRDDQLKHYRSSITELSCLIPLKEISFNSVSYAEAIQDTEGKFKKLFDQHNLDFVIIRPDRYVFDGGKKEEFPFVSNHLIRQISVRSAITSKMEIKQEETAGRSL